jgi:type VI secretion system secreted protein Hcp
MINIQNEARGVAPRCFGPLGFVFLLLALSLGSLASDAAPQVLKGNAGKTPCRISNIDTATGVITAKVNSGGQSFRFFVRDTALRSSLKEGQEIFADFNTQEVFTSAVASGQVVRLGGILTDSFAKSSVGAANPGNVASPATSAQNATAGQSGKSVKLAAPGTPPAPAAGPGAPGSSMSPTAVKGPQTKPAATNCATTTSELFLKLEGIEGESQDACHKGEIELLSFDTSSSSPQHTVFTIVKRVDRASARIWMAAFNGSLISQTTITVLAGSGSPRQLMTYKLKNAMVKAISVSAGTDTREGVTFTPASLETKQEPTNLSLQSSAGPAGVDVFFALPVASTSKAAKPGTSTMRSASASGRQAQPGLGNSVFDFVGGYSPPQSGAGQGSLQNFVITKPIDTDSAALQSAFSSGQRIPSTTVTIRRKDGSGSLAFKLVDVAVVGHSQDVSGSTQQEQVSLRPGRIEIDYK